MLKFKLIILQLNYSIYCATGRWSTNRQCT